MYYKNIIEKSKDTISYKYFFKPIVNELKNVDEIFIQNDGIYNNINPISLYDKDLPLLNKYKINLITNSNHILKEENNSSYKKAVLFGNPKFHNKNTNIENHKDDTINLIAKTRGDLTPLPYTELEIEKLNAILIKNGIETITITKGLATEEELELNTYSDIIHIATHGFYIEAENLDKFNWGIFASGAQNQLENYTLYKTYNDDGIIYGSEIELMNLSNADLVVLSACQTGVGMSGYLGNESLATSFINAGAKNVISTLWPVDDKVTQEYMISFYNN